MKRKKCRQGNRKPVSGLDNNENMGVVDLKDKLLQNYLLGKKQMTKLYTKLCRRLLKITVLNCMVICRTNSGQNKIDHFKFRVDWQRHCSLNMDFKVPGNFKAIIPWTKLCRVYLKDIFQKEHNRQEKRTGQQGGV